MAAAVKDLITEVKMLVDTKARKRSTLGFTIVAAVVFIERWILLGQVTDTFDNTDFFRWFFITFAIPLLILAFAVISNLKIESKDSRLKGVMETLTLTVFLVLIGPFLFTISGTASLFSAVLIFLYPIIIIMAAIYSIANRKDK